MKFLQVLKSWLIGHQTAPTSTREKFYASLAAFLAILALVGEVNYVSSGMLSSLLVVASMGASTFLLFVVPHSPMAQPWPLMGGHLISAAVGVLCAQWIPNPALATAAAVSVSIFLMYWLQCLHPPSAATAMIAVLGGPTIHAMGWKFCYEIIAVNAGTILLMALVVNNLIPGRRYPHRHHAHHSHGSMPQVQGVVRYAELQEDDFRWALKNMDDYIDVSEEDLVDLYELAVKHAAKRLKDK